MPYLITLDVTAHAADQDAAEDLGRALASQIHGANSDVTVVGVVRTAPKGDSGSRLDRIASVLRDLRPDVYVSNREGAIARITDILEDR